MATKQYGHKVDSKGKVKVVETTLPRRLRGHSLDDVRVIKEGPLKRLLNR
jgi:hypothetical protein